MAQKNTHGQIDGKVYNVTLQAEISEAITSVKFPCLFYVLWKTNDQQYVTETGKYSPQGGKVAIHETITLRLPLVYERTKQVFLKKETQVQLNLISKSRPEQPKLVGRVTLDLAALINNNLYPTVTEFPLQFCSVNASIRASFKLIEKIQTDTSLYELQKSIGDGMSFTSGLKAITIPASVDKSRDSISFGRDTSPIHSRVVMDRNIINKQLSSRCTSPKPSQPQRVTKQVDAKEKKEMSSSTAQEQKGEAEQKFRTKSFNGAKINNLIENCHRKLGSVLSEQSKLSDETLKLRGEIDALRLQSSRQRQEDERIRKDLQSKLKDSQYDKLELRQKQTLLDQTNSENNALRNESTRLRDQVSKLREEAVASTIKIAELKDNYNRVSAQLSTSERELKRLDVASEQSSEANKSYSERIQQLQSQLRESQTKCGQLESDKADLIFSLSRKEDEYLKKLQDLKKVMQVLTTERTSSTAQIQKLKSQTQKVSNENSHLTSKLLALQQQLKRLAAIEHEFQEAKHSWNLTNGIVNEQSSKKGQRVTELEQTLMSINERVRWLEGENELLNENCRKSREELVQLQEQKVECLKQAESKYEACFSNLEQQRNNIISILNEKTSVENTLKDVNFKLQSLSTDHEILTNDHVSLIEKQKQLLIASAENNHKIQQLEELLLSGNQQKQKQLSAAAERENDLSMRAKELENQLQALNEVMVSLETKAGMLEDELKSRQDLIIKLQEGLNVQIERTESLNGKLMTYFEKDQKMKDLALLLQEEERKLNDLINDQEANEVRYMGLIKQRENAIVELAKQVEDSQQYGRQLLGAIGQKQQAYDANLKALNDRLQETTLRNEQLHASNQANLSRISELQSIIIDLQSSQTQIQLDYDTLVRDMQSKEDILQAQKSQMMAAIGQLESNIQNLNIRITEKEDAILSEMERCNSISERVVAKEAEITELKESIKQKDKTVDELQKAKAQLENQLTLKEEILQQENRRNSQIQQLYDTLANDLASFDLMVWKDQMREKNQQIHKLESDIAVLGAQVSRTASIERALKIKTIELNSLKFKEKADPTEINELVRLKDEEISSLQAEKDNLAKIEKEFENTQKEVFELRGQLQEIEEERFNIESLSNERALMLEEAKQENRKLMEEITIIGQKHGDLEKLMFEMTSNQNSDNPKSAAVYKVENAVLKCKVAELEQIRSKFQEQALLRETTSQTSIKNSKQNIKQHPESNSSIVVAYQSLKKLFQERGKGKLQEKVIQSIQKLISHDLAKGKAFEQKTKVLSKDFTRLKTQLLKIGEGRGGQEGAKMIGQVKNCQNVICSMVALLS